MLYHLPVVLSVALVELGSKPGPPGIAELVIATGTLKVAWSNDHSCNAGQYRDYQELTHALGPTKPDCAAFRQVVNVHLRTHMRQKQTTTTGSPATRSNDEKITNNVTCKSVQTSTLLQ